VSLNEIDVDNEEIGMNKQRQDEVRSKIYSMLGDRGTVSAATSSSNRGGDSRHAVDIQSPIGEQPYSTNGQYPSVLTNSVSGQREYGKYVLYICTYVFLY
jgi:hypothetical protein